MHKYAKRLPNGQYMVPFLWNQHRSPLRSNRPLAYKRWLSLEKCFERVPKYKALYSQAINEYLDRGEAEIIGEMPEKDVSVTPYDSEYYLPHQGVLKPGNETSRLRVVLDVSVTNYDNVSLNDNLLTGPPVQPDLIGILLRFRLHKYA